MKTLLSFTKKQIAVIFILLGSLSLNAQNSDITMKDIYQEGLEYLQILEDKHNQEIVHIEYDLIFNTKETKRGFSSDYQYMVFAFADHRVEDLDITIFKETFKGWVQVEKDTKSDNTPLVFFKPEDSGTYKIEIKAYKFKSGYSAAHYGLIISHDIPD